MCENLNCPLVAFAIAKDGIKALACALANSVFFILARCMFADICSETSTQTGGTPTVTAPQRNRMSMLHNSSYHQ
jgi:hypothetical protein